MFKLGDLVVGNGTGNYGLTNKYMICRVTSSSLTSTVMTVQVIDSIFKDKKCYNEFQDVIGNQHLGTIHPVKKHYFKLFKKKALKSHLPSWW